MSDNLQMRLVALTTLQNLVEEQLVAVRSELETNMLELNKNLGVKSIDIKMAEETVASVSVVERKQSWHINETELLEWVKQNYPDEIITTEYIRESFKKHLLDTAVVDTANSIVVSSATGEMIDGLIPKPIKQGITLRFKPNGRYVVAREMMVNKTIALSELWSNQQLEITSESEGE